MRLSSLKLSGFKSFADSSTLHFKANRTAVVGPNGCGKSNVIDAIRWVMGESNARQLRGGSMQDIIFTGTVKRKPVSVASVELRFENTYGKLGGAYNAYHELSVRRQVNREGKSEYFLNGTKCRRRDITDIFLGTGLGPRSYAIIEQGMINRLVDAKPEEMRVYIEEAAGVSRYQARRRETLTHLEHTTQNLQRLDDIHGELTLQLKTLKRQAEAAQQYKMLEHQIRGLKIEILSFQCEKSTQLQQDYTLTMTALGEQVTVVRSALNTVEHDLVATGELFQRLMHQSSPLQQEWQSAEKKLAELKNNLAHKQQLVQQNRDTLLQLEQQYMQTTERRKGIDVQLENLFLQHEEHLEVLQEKEQCMQAQQQNLVLLKEQHQQVEMQFEKIKAQVEQQQQKKMQCVLQTEQLHKNIIRIEQQKQMLVQHITSLHPQKNAEESLILEAEQNDLQAEMLQVAEKIKHAQSQLENVENIERNAQQQLQILQNQIQLLEREKKQLESWVSKQSQHSAHVVTLMQILRLSTAAQPYAGLIEKFLAKWLTGHLINEHQNFETQVARQLKPSHVVPLELEGCIGLNTWIEAPQHSLWANVGVISHLEQALAKQEKLLFGQSILTLDGYHVGSDWVIALEYDEDSLSAQGALSQRVRLDEITSELVQLFDELVVLKPCCVEYAGMLSDIKTQLKDLNAYYHEQQQQLQRVHLSFVKQQAAQHAFTSQQQQFEQQLQQLEMQLEEDTMQRDVSDIDLHALNVKLEHALPDYKTLEFQLEQLTDQLASLQKQHNFTQQEMEVARRQVVQNTQQIELLEKDVSFLTEQQQQIQIQKQQAAILIEPMQVELPLLEIALKVQQELTAKLQEKWQKWQHELHQVQSKQHDLTQQRQHIQQQDQHLREQLETQRLAWQSAKSDLQHYTEQLGALNADMILGLTLDLKVQQVQLEQAQQTFSKLGAVNLAASDEYDDIAQRYAELDHQMQDVRNTVDQLQAAMKSIDQETRKLFMHTFDCVNAELQILFPKVFNGGEARLSLETDWQSGVKLIARPPGKRNSSLALLSGGEKALTALALVFAIFRLNPAPFCVLDEVDAPLDDANVGRFCNLVKELSEQVQFIYITHNKLAMTMATDLLGVTMPELGTSKLVTVNLEQAEEYSLVAES